VFVRGYAHGRHWRPSSLPAAQPLPLGMKVTDTLTHARAQNNKKN